MANIISDINTPSYYCSIAHTLFNCTTSANSNYFDVYLDTTVTTNPFRSGDQIWVKFTNAVNFSSSQYLRILNSSGTALVSAPIAGFNTVSSDPGMANAIPKSFAGGIIKFMYYILGSSTVWVPVGEYSMTPFLANYQVTSVAKTSVSTTDNSTSNSDVTFSFYASGWYPVGIVGWNCSTRKVVPSLLYITDQDYGMATVTWKPWVPRYIGTKSGSDPSTSSTHTLTVYMLWVNYDVR